MRLSNLVAEPARGNIQGSSIIYARTNSYPRRDVHRRPGGWVAPVHLKHDTERQAGLGVSGMELGFEYASHPFLTNGYRHKGM
jgi:hypothetical protein